MAKKNKKSEVVEKVAVETGAEVSDLERLPVEALEKIEAAVPDIDRDITAEEYQEVPCESDGTDENGEGEVQDNSGTLPSGKPDVGQAPDKEKRFVGYHPITKEKVYL